MGHRSALAFPPFGAQLSDKTYVRSSGLPIQIFIDRQAWRNIRRMVCIVDFPQKTLIKYIYIYIYVSYSFTIQLLTLVANTSDISQMGA